MNVLPPWLDSLVALVREAGDASMPIYHGNDLKIEIKADDSPVTQADFLVHQRLLTGLAELFPTMPVLSEESDDLTNLERLSWQDYWLIDPIDGTKEFIAKTNEFTVNLAWIRQHRPVFGIVYAPALNRLYYGGPNMGAFKDHQAIHCVPANLDNLQVVGSRRNKDGRWRELIEQGDQAEFRAVGSSLKFCHIAEGLADWYPRFHGISEWDIGAAQAILEGAGGQVCDWQGQSLRYNKPDLGTPAFFACADDRLKQLLLLGYQNKPF